MYDAIVTGMGELPPGVSLAEVVVDSEEAELIAAAAAGNISAAQARTLHACHCSEAYEHAETCSIKGIGFPSKTQQLT